MKRRFFIFHASFFILFLLATQVHAQYNVLNVWMKNGDVVNFALNDQLRIVASSSTELTVETGRFRISYPVETLRKFTVSNDTLPTQIMLSEGWNWMSHNLTDPIAVSTFDQAQQVLSETATAYNDPQLGWVGEIKTLSSSEGYKINMLQGSVYTFTSASISDVSPLISLHRGWNWVGYPLSFPSSLSVALSGSEWEEGDCIAGQDAFAVYTDGAWEGTLTTFSPTSSYLFYSAKAKSFSYLLTSEAKDRGVMHIRQQPAASPFTYNPYAYANTMNIIARVQSSDETADYTVAAFSGDECRGVGKMKKGRIYLTVHGAAADPITFQVVSADGAIHAATQTCSFADGLVGSAKSPYLLSWDDATSVRSIEGDAVPAEPVNVYTLSGQFVKTMQPSMDGSIDVLLHELPAGTYVVQTSTMNFKILKK